MSEPGAYRRRDIETAVDAAQSVNATYLENMVFDVVQATGEQGAILDDITRATGLDKVTISPRLRPLVRKGFVIETDRKRQGLSGRGQRVWKATPPRRIILRRNHAGR
jgi:predicted transcriptional regulator